MGGMTKKRLSHRTAANIPGANEQKGLHSISDGEFGCMKRIVNGNMCWGTAKTGFRAAGAVI
jgi:hypothetical protein